MLGSHLSPLLRNLNPWTRDGRCAETVERPGVYILLGADDVPTDQREAYIGESEGVHGRIAYHASPNGGKSFWEDAIVLVSKDENLTKSHARYVESRLIPDALSNPRWSLPMRRA